MTKQPCYITPEAMAFLASCATLTEEMVNQPPQPCISESLAFYEQELADLRAGKIRTDFTELALHDHPLAAEWRATTREPAEYRYVTHTYLDSEGRIERTETVNWFDGCDGYYGKYIQARIEKLRLLLASRRARYAPA